MSAGAGCSRASGREASSSLSRCSVSGSERPTSRARHLGRAPRGLGVDRPDRLEAPVEVAGLAGLGHAGLLPGQQAGGEAGRVDDDGPLVAQRVVGCDRDLRRRRGARGAPRGSRRTRRPRRTDGPAAGSAARPRGRTPRAGRPRTGAAPRRGRASRARSRGSARSACACAAPGAAPRCPWPRRPRTSRDDRTPRPSRGRARSPRGSTGRDGGRPGRGAAPRRRRRDSGGSPSPCAPARGSRSAAPTCGSCRPRCPCARRRP